MPWVSPNIQVRWGEYFKPDIAEQKTTVETTQLAMGGTPGPLLSVRQAVEKIAPIFGIENVDAAVEALEKERDDAAKRELDATTAALDAEARAKRTAAGPAGAKPPASGGGGRPPGG
jgi:hypothetical protein